MFNPAEASLGTALPGGGFFTTLTTWIKGHALAITACGVAFQLSVLASMIAIHSIPYVHGERVLLHVRPVDPRDPFRGEYVQLSYDFSQVDPAQIEQLTQRFYWRNYDGADTWINDQAVYVTLVPEAGTAFYRPDTYATTQPDSGLYLKGRFSSSRSGQLVFGIESYFVQEGEGKELERLRNANNLAAEVAVTPWGQAALVRLE